MKNERIIDNNNKTNRAIFINRPFTSHQPQQQQPNGVRMIADSSWLNKGAKGVCDSYFVLFEIQF
jgi:hypothetical protein